MNPLVSFQHIVREIAVNRESPSELVREMISNAYDAGASSFRIIPFAQRKGLIFFDDGVGLSMPSANQEKSGYQSFFSIGNGTKSFGEATIGYKCQGSKLTFACARLTVITRCEGEQAWRYKTLDNPKENLSNQFDISPAVTDTPWSVVLDSLFSASADQRTSNILKTLNQEFFLTDFRKGLLLIVEEIEGADFSKYFDVGDNAQESHLYNYIRFYTAHGDVRMINKDQGFNPAEIRTVVPKNTLKPRCLLWSSSNLFVEIPRGWPYLTITEEQRRESVGPKQVASLSKGSFFGRFASTFSLEGYTYSLVLAIDGYRRALEQYSSLGRQRAAKSYIPLSTQRGVVVSSQGIRVVIRNEILDTPELQDFVAMKDGISHFTLFIDGPFELVTNRNALAPQSQDRLRSSAFLGKVRDCLNKWRREKSESGRVFSELLDRIAGDSTEYDRQKYVEERNRLEGTLKSRESFAMKDVPSLDGNWFYAPLQAEENCVAVYYALFGTHVPKDSPLIEWWRRPLTFNSRGIDSIANGTGQYVDLEYKLIFNVKDIFNHAFLVVDYIVCWDYECPKVGDSMRDDLQYRARVDRFLDHDGEQFGFVFSDVMDSDDSNPKQTEVYVIGLKKLLDVTFGGQLKWRKPVKS